MIDISRVCKKCGMPEEQWLENGGDGYFLDGKLYCCSGCANGTGCSCSQELPSDEPVSTPADKTLKVRKEKDI
jgi:hypothetical protein